MELIRVDPRLRRRIRIAVYSGFAILMLGMAGAAWWMERPGPRRGDVDWSRVDFSSLPEVQLLQEYVRIDTSVETGSELAGAEFLARELAAAGLQATIERLGEKEANLWAVVEGEEPGALVLHNHIDVYPVRDPEAWDHPPFEGSIALPWIYGRGVFDMKSVAIAQLQAFKAIAASGRRPRRSLIFLATGSEEIGSELGARWILARHPELRERFWAVVTEGGVIEPVSREEIKYWGIEFAQRRFVEGAACAGDRERLVRLRREILQWVPTAARWRVTPEVESFLAAYAGTRTHPEYRALLSQTWGALHAPARFRRLPRYLQSMFASEVFPFEPEKDPTGGYRMRIVIHLLPGDDFAEVRDRLLPDWLVHGVALTLGEPLGFSGGSSLDHPVYRQLEESVRELFPDTRVGPYFVPWSATDARFFRLAGIPAYGFSPFVIFSTDTFRVDGPNERIELPGYVRGVELYRHVVERLVQE